MNCSIRRVFNVYCLLVLVSLVYVPWTGHSLGGAAYGPVYALLWAPPRAAGWFFVLDVGRLFFEAVSLSAVMAAATAALWDPDSGSHQGSSRPS